MVANACEPTWRRIIAATQAGREHDARPGRTSVDHDASLGWLAEHVALVAALDAVVNGVAQQMEERIF